LAVLLSIRDYVRLVAPEPEVLRVIGEESRRKEMDKLASRRIDQSSKPPAHKNESADDSASSGRRVRDTRLDRGVEAVG
jgi:hypothetical protein